MGANNVDITRVVNVVRDVVKDAARGITSDIAE